MQANTYLIRCSVAALVASVGLSAPAHAQAPSENVEQLRTTVVALIRTLLEQKLITPQKAAELLRGAGLNENLLAGIIPKETADAPAAPVVRVPYVPEVVKQELRDEIKKELTAQAQREGWVAPNTLPDWASRVTLTGSVRSRFQSERPDPSNDIPQLIDAFFQLPQGTTQNTTEDRDRFRLRARLGLEAKVAEQVNIGMRVVTSSGGDDNSPVSINVDQGRFNRRFGAAFDLGYIDWRPRPDLYVAGGRIANPYASLSSDLIWAPDLTFDGAAVAYRPRLFDKWTGLFVVGAHPLRETESSAFNSAGDKWLYGAQAGLRWEPGKDTLRFGVSYYDFSKIEGQLNPATPVDNTFFNQTAPLFRQRGNTMFNVAFQSSSTGVPVFGIAPEFKVLGLFASYEFARFDPIRITVAGDWMRNLGFDREEILARIGSSVVELPTDKTGATGAERERSKAYRLSLQVGNSDIARFGAWQVFGGYRHLERDAVPDAFTSTDYRLGGTDQKASFFGVNFGLARNTWLTLRYVSASTLDRPVTFSWDTWFLDIEGRF